MKKRVCIIQPVMKGYRLPFFLGLGARLARAGTRLEVVYGTPWPEEAKRGDHVELPVPLGTRLWSRMLFGNLLLMPVLWAWLRADLVVVEHANKNLLNYLLALMHALGLKRVAYWGHGRDRQSSSDSMAERFKRRSLHWADWWFAYTSQSALYVAEQGFSPARITVVENAIDTRALRDELASVSDEDLRLAREGLGWNEDARIAVFCGSLYANKRLDLLFAAADRAHDLEPSLHLLIIGDGPLAGEVASFATRRPWVKQVGPRFGREKAVLLTLGFAWLNPGLVGLGILDAFCAGLPVLTTDLPMHGPEIEYLRSGENGLMVSPDEAAFAEALIGLMLDPDRLARLREGAMKSTGRYSIETMVENFACGIERCLAES